MIEDFQKKPIAIFFGLLLLIGVFLLSCKRSAVEYRCQDCNVILISIDALRADHMGCYGYARDTTPNLDKLAGESVLFEQAFSPIGHTLLTHVSMLTSLDPLAHGAVPLTMQIPELNTLAKHFQERRYRTAGFATLRTWLNENNNFSRGFEDFYSADVSAGRLNEHILPWLRANAARPFFMFVHYYDVHSDTGKLPYETGTPYDYKFKSGNEGFSGCDADNVCGSKYLAKSHNKDFVRPSDQDRQSMVALYDGGAAYTDDQTGRIIGELEKLGLTEKTIVVITADHGEEFLEHGRFLHAQCYYEVAHVPLIMRMPKFGAAPRRVADTVATIDIMPTLLDAVGIEYSNLQGRSLLPLAAGRAVEPRPAFSHVMDVDTNKLTDAIFVRDARYTLLARDNFATLELFDRQTDPSETNNVAQAHEVLTRELAEQARRWLAQSEQLRSAQVQQGSLAALSAADREKLQSLGYIK